MLYALTNTPPQRPGLLEANFGIDGITVGISFFDNRRSLDSTNKALGATEGLVNRDGKIQGDSIIFLDSDLIDNMVYSTRVVAHEGLHALLHNNNLSHIHNNLLKITEGVSIPFDLGTEEEAVTGSAEFAKDIVSGYIPLARLSENAIAYERNEPIILKYELSRESASRPILFEGDPNIGKN